VGNKESKSLYLTVIGLSLIQLCSILLPSIPYGEGVFFGYSPYIFDLVISSVFLIVLSVPLSVYFLGDRERSRASFLSISKATYFSISCFATIKVIAFLAGWDSDFLRDKLFTQPNIYVKIVWEYGPTIIIMLLLLLFQEHYNKLFKFFTAFGPALLIMLIFRIVSSYDVAYIPAWHSTPKVLEQKSINPQARQVIWIVFDEFDPGIAFSDEQIKFLPNFNGHLKNSVYAPNMYPPSNRTLVSLPSMLIGQSFNRTETISTAKEILIGNEGKVNFEFKNTIFKRVERLGLNSSILGFYLPYCDIFKEIECRAFPWADESKWYSALVNFYLGKKFSREVTDYVDPTTHTMAGVTSKQINALSANLKDKADFKFLHLNIPHLPGDYAKKVFNENPKTLIDVYKLNLKLTDRVLGEIDFLISEYPRDTMMIISSDHWYRPRSAGGVYPALFLAKIKGDNTPIEVPSLSSGIYIAELVEKYFNKEVSSHKDIANFLMSRNFHGVSENIEGGKVLE
jgi:hypothetical protein